MLRRLVLLLSLLALLAALPAAAGALGVAEVARELRCPTCNAPLDVSNAPSAQRMKAIIADEIAAGRSKQEIIDMMVADFGEQVLATPPKRGYGLVAWLTPLLVLLAGLIAVPLIARSLSRRRGPAAPAPEVSAADRARVDEELRRWNE